jgi:hypothetical protein
LPLVKFRCCHQTRTTVTEDVLTDGGQPDEMNVVFYTVDG